MHTTPIFGSENIRHQVLTPDDTEAKKSENL